MVLPVGMLIFCTHYLDDDKAVIIGNWYYKETYVPNSVTEKMQAVNDLKSKRCTVLFIHGQFDQIMEVLLQSDLFDQNTEIGAAHYKVLETAIKSTKGKKGYIYDDAYNIKGSSLCLDIQIDIEETLEDIKDQINQGKPVSVHISKDWSLSKEILKSLNL